MKKDGNYIFELILTLAFLGCGVVSQDPIYFTASGLFAVAMQIGVWRSEK